MKTLRYIGLTALSAVMAMGFAACDDDDVTIYEEPATRLASPAPELDAATAYTLTFAWAPVSNASQYAYSLADANGEVVDGGVISGYKAKITGLNHTSEYTFTIQAMPTVYNAEYGSSLPASLQASTLKVTRLEAPQVKVKIQGMGCTVSWNEVENAEYYYYTYTDGEDASDSASTYDTSFSIRNLTFNEYTVKVMAMSDNELYSNSPYTTITFKR